jgi:hypothetical protein
LYQMLCLHPWTPQSLGLANFQVHTLALTANLVNLNPEKCSVRNCTCELVKKNLIVLTKYWGYPHTKSLIPYTILTKKSN